MLRSWLLISVVVAIATVASSWGQVPELLWYRLSTSLRALKAIYTLPEKHVRDFLDSYKLFEQEYVTGQNQEAESTVNYYQVLNHLCAVGEVEKMYIPPVVDANQSIFQNQVMWEEKGLADQLDLGPASQVLDVGCGRGRVAHHVASVSGAHVTGLNIDRSQLKMAKEHARITQMEHQLSFVHGNFNDPLPFDDETFDALYQVQVLTYTIDAVKLFKEMYRVLKPGGKLSFLDYVQLPAFNSSDAKHLELLRKVKPVLGAVWTPKPSDFTEALEKAGFQILSSEDASVGKHQYPLIEKAETFFVATRWLLSALTKVHVVPSHLLTLFERLTKDGEAFVEADKLGLFTTSWQIIAQKPMTRMSDLP
ncbi:Sterol 24-C-methyltransferase (Delta(24)-sterol C-methyltransferase) [Durusdinium trenchii]|uniref:Sterol 24-C-methyltransferase (Delta(24)-sterol C-methyltransferase) n=1 Tax=Durusdinium trenchii TaxID=1381693 RepID=A0ABP0LKS8_9DINO